MLNIYLIRDVKSGIYSTIHLSPNDTTAMRQFFYDFREYQFRHDLELYRLGSFDPESGKIDLLPNAPQFVTVFQEKIGESING